jgi:ribosomal protein L11 methyltransferase
MKLTSITLKSAPSEAIAGSIDMQAFLAYGCSGKHDYSLEEETVDEILGDDAFCGGELSEKHFKMLEDALSENKSASYFWPTSEKTHINGFVKMLEDENLIYGLQEFDEVDWNSKWRDAFSEIIVNEQCKIIPSWNKKEKSTNDLFIYPGMGFGTGNHETTFLCLELYYSVNFNLSEGLSCLDFGCGSGILGIAPMKDKNANVCFVDIDEAALDNCVMNLELNDHSDYLGLKEVILRERFEKNDFDLIFANILEHVLIEEKKILDECLNVNGHLIVSGLLNDQVDNIVSTYNKFEVVKVCSRGDWSAILFKKK